MSRKDAYVLAIKSFDRWEGGSVVVDCGNNDYVALPGDTMCSDFYLGPRNVVLSLRNRSEAEELGRIDTDDDIEETVARLMAKDLITSNWAQGDA